MIKRRSKEIDLYYIDKDYIAFMKSVESRIQHNYDNQTNKKPAEYKVLTLNAETLKAKAATLYKAVLKGENKYFCHVSYHFTVLEKALENYLNAKQGE